MWIELWPKCFFHSALWFMALPLASGICCWMKKKNDTLPTRNQMTITTDHSGFSKCNLDTFEGYKIQTHFPRPFQVEVNVCRTFWSGTAEQCLPLQCFCLHNSLLFLFFLISFLPTQSSMRASNHTKKNWNILKQDHKIEGHLTNIAKQKQSL